MQTPEVPPPATQAAAFHEDVIQSGGRVVSVQGLGKTRETYIQNAGPRFHYRHCINDNR